MTVWVVMERDYDFVTPLGVLDHMPTEEELAPYGGSDGCAVYSYELNVWKD